MISLRVDTLVLANLVQRPTRTLASMGGVALGVVLIVVTAGLAEGMLRSRGERESNIGAEILFQASGSFGVGVETAPLTLPVAYAAALSKIPGVTGATPVGRFIRRGSRGFGFELIEGIVVAPNGEHATYFDVARLRLVQGHLPTRKYQIIIDRVRAEDPTVGIGAKLNLLGRDFEVVGIYEPEVGARVKMPLDTMQDLLGNKDRCSWILVKCASAGIQRSVAARIESRFPGNQIIFTRDIPGLLSRGLPILNVFLNTVIGLATVISSLVI
ncbi:MAG: ABC transporter permease, partial [Acidobacteriota bacterium]